MLKIMQLGSGKVLACTLDGGERKGLGAGEENGRVDTMAASMCLRERPLLLKRWPGCFIEVWTQEQ